MSTQSWLHKHGIQPDELRRAGGLKWAQVPFDVLPAWVADMDFRPPREVTNVVERMGMSAYVYADPSTSRRACVAFTNRMMLMHGWSLEASRVRLLTDLNQALTAVVLAYSTPSQAVAVLTPIYRPFELAVTGSGRRLAPVPLTLADDSYHLDFNALSSVLRRPDVRLLLLCNPHNPTGHVFTLAELETIARLAKENEVTVVSDEIHAELVHAGHCHVPFDLVLPDLGCPSVILQSATKTFNMAGTRCAFLYLGSTSLAEQFDAVFPYRILGQVSTWGMEATAAAWTEADEWLKHLKSVLAGNRDTVLAWATSHPDIQAVAPDATYFSWMRLDGATDAAAFFLEHARVALSAGPEFGATGDWFRLNFATSPNILEEILLSMSGALQREPVAP